MLVPDEVQNYVVVHELCHIKEMNHSVRFWAEVEKVMPNYREYKKWLKENGNYIICRMQNSLQKDMYRHLKCFQKKKILCTNKMKYDKIYVCELTEWGYDSFLKEYKTRGRVLNIKYIWIT